MRALFRIALTVSAMALTATGAAAARAASNFDGVYVGVSATADNGSHCPTPQTPGPLTIANSSATSTTGFFTGTADTNGHVVLHTKESTRFEGQIDASGVLKAGGGTPRWHLHDDLEKALARRQQPIVANF
jgi:hypothetical protein